MITIAKKIMYKSYKWKDKLKLYHLLPFKRNRPDQFFSSQQVNKFTRFISIKFVVLRKGQIDSSNPLPSTFLISKPPLQSKDRLFKHLVRTIETIPWYSNKNKNRGKDCGKALFLGWFSSVKRRDNYDEGDEA